VSEFGEDSKTVERSSFCEATEAKDSRLRKCSCTKVVCAAKSRERRLGLTCRKNSLSIEIIGDTFA
jgi:hypothetical protein